MNHILRPQKMRTWCEDQPPRGWYFTSLDHAAKNGLYGHPIFPCGLCINAAVKAMLQTP